MVIMSLNKLHKLLQKTTFVHHTCTYLKYIFKKKNIPYNSNDIYVLLHRMLAAPYEPKHKAELIQSLVDCGVDLNVCNYNGYTILMFICSCIRYDTHKIVRCLTQSGVNVNARTKKGWNVLMYLVTNFRDKDVYSLNLHTKNYEKMREIIKITKILLDSGIKVRMRNNKGHTALMFVNKMIKRFSERPIIKYRPYGAYKKERNHLHPSLVERYKVGVWFYKKLRNLLQFYESITPSKDEQKLCRLDEIERMNYLYQHYCTELSYFNKKILFIQ